MLTRRAFIAGTAGTLSTTLLQRFEWFLRDQKRPLIEAPAAPTEHLYVSREYGDELLITLGKPDEAPEPPTWAEYFERTWGIDAKDKPRLLDACHEWGLDPDYLDTECEWETWITHWCRHESGQAKAFSLLEELDVGTSLLNAEGEVGGLTFIDGPSPGNDYLGVHADNELSISLLQHRLNELRTGIQVHAVL